MKRLRYALAAAVPMLALVAIRTYAACFPLCAIYNDSNPEWYLFFCYLCG
jgi:hypothetical protein